MPTTKDPILALFEGEGAESDAPEKGGHGDASREAKLRQIGNWPKAGPACGKGVPEPLGIPLTRVAKKK